MIQYPNHSTSLPNPDDVQLWEGLQHGDQKSYSIIYNTYVDNMYAYGKKLCSKTSLVEDAIQDVFMELWKYKNSLGSIRSIKAYLFTCLRRQLIRIAKKDKFLILNDYYLNEDNFEFELSAQEVLVEAQGKQEKLDKIKKALSSLTKRQKEIIYLRYFQDFTYQEISQMMGLNEKSTYNLISKALNLLKDKLLIFVLVYLTY